MSDQEERDYNAAHDKLCATVEQAVGRAYRAGISRESIQSAVEESILSGIDSAMLTYIVTTRMGVRKWVASTAEHAREQHEDAFGGELGEAIAQVEVATRNEQGECAFCAFMEPGNPSVCSNCGCIHYEPTGDRS